MFKINWNNEYAEQAVPMISNRILAILILLCLMCIGSVAHAQADRGGLGGNWSEADLKHFLERLKPYLQSKEGRIVFPDVESYDLAHPRETIENLASELNPRLVDHPVYDGEHNERDCVSYIAPVRYFECNRKSLAPKPGENTNEDLKSEFYGSMYRLVLHEVFVQAGIEKPLAKEIPSTYSISSRLMVHLEDFPEWVPGESQTNVTLNIDDAIHPHAQYSLGLTGREMYDAYHLGIDTKIQIPVRINSTDWKFGIDFQYTHKVAGNPAGDSKTDLTWNAQLLITGEYDFKTSSWFKPYLGVGIGLSENHRSYVDIEAYSGITERFDEEDTVAYAVYAVNPGFNFGNTSQFFFEVPITFSESQIFVSPTLGMHF